MSAAWARHGHGMLCVNRTVVCVRLQALRACARSCKHFRCYLIFIGPCIIAIVDEWKNQLGHLLFYFTYYALSMFRTLIYPSSGARDCVDELPHRSSCSQFVVCWSFCCGWYLVVFVLQASAWKTNTSKYQPQQKLQHTTNWEQDDRCGNSSTQSQAPEDGYINVRNILST